MCLGVLTALCLCVLLLPRLLPEFGDSLAHLPDFSLSFQRVLASEFGALGLEIYYLRTQRSVACGDFPKLRCCL
ncbi:hypothetical protein BB31_24630 [Amycolatopsis lurida NRRL 2430]|uniref:Uncharacterized protein n=1 Tax=Amycolatopsis lurida NRRL 2430 TaxID=1460371 RepID=A0A2P2FPK8_AMYLU|nr:hypothetical protein BB31_24630 [Amycolatopsis lurida NRRL 2430]